MQLNDYEEKRNAITARPVVRKTRQHEQRQIDRALRAQKTCDETTAARDGDLRWGGGAPKGSAEIIPAAAT